MTMETRPAEYIKCKLIDYLLSADSNIIIGNEVMYGKLHKVVDLLVIKDNKLIAVEIKSESDNLKRLPEQLVEYSKVFDKVIVASAPSHIKKIADLTNSQVGIYSVSGEIKKICRPKVNKSQDKTDILYTINANFLKNLYPQFKMLNSDEIRKKLSSSSKATIHQILVDFYRNRLSERFQIFIKDRGSVTLIDDIPTLSSFHLIESV